MKKSKCTLFLKKVEETDIGKQEKYKCAGKVFSLNRQPSVYG